MENFENKQPDPKPVPELKQTEWCEYSGMPSPEYYMREEETKEDEKNSHTNIS